MVNKLDAIYYKPIQCGLDENGKRIQILSEKSAKILLFGMKHIFQKPLSPNIAADKEGKKILISKFNSKITINLNKN